MNTREKFINMEANSNLNNLDTLGSISNVVFAPITCSTLVLSQIRFFSIYCAYTVKKAQEEGKKK